MANFLVKPVEPFYPIYNFATGHLVGSQTNFNQARDGAAVDTPVSILLHRLEPRFWQGLTVLFSVFRIAFIRERE